MFGMLKRPLMEHHREIKSPDGRTVCKVELKSGRLVYSIKRDGKVVLRDSRVGFLIKNEEPLDDNLMIVRMHERSLDETWERAWGEERYVRNNYNEVALYLSEISGEKRLFTVRFRVFDDGVAFRYEFPPQPKFQSLAITDELTEFNVDPNAKAWKIPAYQPDRYEYNYERWPVDALVQSVHTPLTIETPQGHFISIHEAALYDYGSMTVKLNERRVLKTDITPISDGVRAYIDLPFNTPWRVVMIADSAMGLTQNRMIYSLNPAPSENIDFSFVEPLKFMGIWWAMFVGEWTWARGDRHGATTEHATDYLDACRRLGIKGLLVEGWNNGWDGDWLQNGSDSDFLHPTEDFDLENIAHYAKQLGVELIGHHETVGFIDNYEAQLEKAYQYYTSLGIRYIKSGYAGSMMTTGGKREFHHSQIGVRHYQKTVELAAKYGIMLDIHEPIKGTGIERTWPNLLTREGARGQEYEGGALSPSHACIIPFTRLLAGGMDYTSGIFDVTNEAKKLRSTIARQLAFYVTIYSGMQMAADRPRFYEEVRPDAYKFIRDVPVSFERSVPLLGEIGVYYVVARQGRGEPHWYIGGVTNEEAHKVRLSLEFLDDGEYIAEIYRDGDDADFRNNQLSMVIEQKKVTKMDFLEIWMAPGGGFAVRLKKQ